MELVHTNTYRYLLELAPIDTYWYLLESVPIGIYRYLLVQSVPKGTYWNGYNSIPIGGYWNWLDTYRYLLESVPIDTYRYLLVGVGTLSLSSDTYRYLLEWVPIHTYIGIGIYRYLSVPIGYWYLLGKSEVPLGTLVPIGTSRHLFDPYWCQHPPIGTCLRIRRFRAIGSLCYRRVTPPLVPTSHLLLFSGTYYK